MIWNATLLLLVTAVGMLTASGCSQSPSWIRSLNASSSFSVYEGLPHQLREADLLEREKRRPDITMIGGFPFYTPSVAVDTSQAMQFKKILGDDGRYVTYRGAPTDCGPFHPDFAVQWTDGAMGQQILICFSCSEARVVSNNEQEDYYFKGVSDLKSLLWEYSSKRPNAERVPGA